MDPSYSKVHCTFVQGGLEDAAMGGIFAFRQKGEPDFGPLAL
jgi:hypothetical protein